MSDRRRASARGLPADGTLRPCSDRTIGRGLGVAMAVALLAACGGGKPAKQDTAPAHSAKPSASQRRQRALEALHNRQVMACGRLCPRLTECAVKDTRKHDPDKLKGMNLPAFERYYTSKCEDACDGKSLSVRQVRVVDRCVRARGDCKTLLDCLDAAQPQRRASKQGKRGAGKAAGGGSKD